MAITFPASPSDGDVFTNTTTGVKYIYNATDGVWKTHVWPTNTNYLQLSGGTLTGDLSLGTNDLTAQDITTTGAVSVGTGLTVGNGLTVSDGNIVMANGHGIDFSATGDGNGTITSELLNEYEEGKWTPQDGSGAGLTFASPTDGHYVKIGNFFHCWGRVTFPATVNTNQAQITNLPFTSSGSNVIYSGSISVQNTGFTNIRVMYEDTRIQFRNEANNTFGNHQLSGDFIYFTFQGYTGTV